jgi:hypothetical protein
LSCAYEADLAHSVVAQCQAETVSLRESFTSDLLLVLTRSLAVPLDGSFIRLADRYVDEAYGVMTDKSLYAFPCDVLADSPARWNYCIFQAALMCFEINSPFASFPAVHAR